MPEPPTSTDLGRLDVLEEKMSDALRRIEELERVRAEGDEALRANTEPELPRPIPPSALLKMRGA